MVATKEIRERAKTGWACCPIFFTLWINYCFLKFKLSIANYCERDVAKLNLTWFGKKFSKLSVYSLLFILKFLCSRSVTSRKFIQCLLSMCRCAALAYSDRTILSFVNFASSVMCDNFTEHITGLIISTQLMSSSI